MSTKKSLYRPEYFILVGIAALMLFAAFALASTWMWLDFLRSEQLADASLHAAAGEESKSLEIMDVYLRERDARISALNFDRTRLEDAANILLALQEFHTSKGEYPPTLAALSEEGLLEAGQIADPETLKRYEYLRRQTDFVLCIVLSDRMKGVNTQECTK